MMIIPPFVGGILMAIATFIVIGAAVIIEPVIEVIKVIFPW
jgi:hypothetical protein